MVAMIFFSRVLTHVLLAGFVLASALVMLEWIIPGSVSARLALYPFLVALGLATVLAAPFLRTAPPFQRVCGALLALLLPVVWLVAFALRSQTTFVWGAVLTLLVLMIVFLLAYSSFTRENTSV